MITTTQNKQIKQIIKLKKSARERRKQELFLVEGIRMFTEIPEEYLYKVYASEDFYNEHRVIFEHMDVELVSPQVMKEISDTDDTTGSSCTGEDDEIFFRRSSRTGKTIISGA